MPLWLKRWWRRTRTFLWFFGLACFVLFALALLGQKLNLPNESWWKAGSVPAQMLLPLGFIAGVYQVSLAVYRRKSEKARRQERIDRDLERMCRDAAAHIDDHCNDVKLSAIGIHIWTRVGRGSKESLRQSYKFLLRSERPSSGVKFTKGKGIIGVCWETAQTTYADLEQDLYPKLALSEQAFNGLPADERFGMERADVLKTQNYKSIVAFPLFDSAQRVIGIFSVDCQAVGKLAGLLAATYDDAAFQAILGLCQTYLVQSREDEHA